MKKIILLAILFINISAFSQEDAWVYFNAKPDAQQYFDNPLTMLTQRALDRRTTQNIPLDINDVPIHQPYVAQVEAAAGITVVATSKWFNAVHVRGTQSQISALLGLAFVESVDFADNALDGRGVPSQPIIKKVNKTMETAVNFNYGDSANQIEMLNGHLLHQQDFTGTGKVVAVMDGGFPGVNTASTFARLRDNNLILGGYDYVNRDPNFYTGISHGTMVLSTMGGFKDGELVGTAPDAGYYLFITEDGENESPLEESLWVEAAEEADRLGVDIINTSLGYSEFDNPNYDYTYADMNGTTTFISRGADMAFSRGMICVTSAGNQGNDDWQYITAPGDAINVLTVGAVNASGNYAGFSSQGPSFDGRVKPDVVAQGQNSVVSGTSGTIGTANGTSFSGPIIAGMVASFWQAVPTKTNSEIMQFIRESASIYSNPDNELGYGIPDFSLALTNALGLPSFESVQFIVYPNPANTYISIAFPAGFENSTITLYNTIGQTVRQQIMNTQGATLRLDGLHSGIYMYKIESDGFSQNGKIIKE